MYNLDHHVDVENHTQAVRWNTMGQLLKDERALKSFGVPVDVIGEDTDLARHAFLSAVLRRPLSLTN